MGASVALVVLTALSAPTGSTQEPDTGVTPGRASGDLELVGQSPTVGPDGTFELWVRTDGLPEDGLLTLVLHGRVRSRSELAASMEGRSLRSQVYNVTTPIASLPVRSDGSRRVTISLDPAVPGGVALGAAGAYPLEITAQDASGAALSELITHVLVRPGPGDESPPLAVAVVARLDASPARQSDGTIQLSRRAVNGLSDLVGALADEGDVPATLAITPETVAALAAGDDPAHATVLDRLRAAAAGRAILNRPYVEVSPDALVDAGLGSELSVQLDAGAATLADVLGVRPHSTTWIAGPDLDVVGLRALRQAGFERLVIDPDQLEPLRSGVLSLSLAQPFLVSTGSSRSDDDALDAMALDPIVLDRLATTESEGLEVSQLLAELAMLWYEQPGIPRAVVVPVDRSVRGDVLRALLDGLDTGGIFDPVELDELFDAANPLRQPGGGRVDRPLQPEATGRITRTVAQELLAARAVVTSFAGLVGTDSPRLDEAAAQLLLASGVGLDAAERRAHIAAARSSVDAVIGAVSAPGRETITLTARDGNVPLTLRNDTGAPVQVTVRLRSPKLEFPGGEEIPVTLTEVTTRLDIGVRARASGAFPLRVQITSPDGALTLASVDYSVRSTAVSGVGLVLSAGAACFLLVWWARHWRRTRRSHKLIAARHPALVDAAEVEPSGAPRDAGPN